MGLCILFGIVLYFCANVGAIDGPVERLAQQQQPEQLAQNQSEQQQQQQQQEQIYHHRPIPLVRLPSNTLLKYTAYKDVSILHFRVPTDTRFAYFSFKANEETRSAFREYKIRINSHTYLCAKSGGTSTFSHPSHVHFNISVYPYNIYMLCICQLDFRIMVWCQRITTELVFEPQWHAQAHTRTHTHTHTAQTYSNIVNR